MAEHTFPSRYDRPVRDLGTPGDRLRRAVNSGSLPIAEAALREIGKPSLTESLEIVGLMAATRDDRFPRAAARWAALLADDRDLGTDGTRKILSMLELLPETPALLDRLRSITESMDEWP